MLRLIDIEKSYTLGAAEIDVLRRVNLDIREGDLLSITGPSGSGKTTLMNVLGLLSQPTAGTYLLRGQDVSSMDGTRCRHAATRTSASCSSPST